LEQIQNPPQYDPQTQYLMQQLNELRQNQQQWHNSIQQQEQARASQELEQFSQAGNAHFDAVRGDMADLLETGKATSLQDAYEKAVWMNPDIRQSLIEQQRLDAQKKAMAEAQSLRAKTAAVSVKSSSPSAGGVQTNGSDLRSLIASQFG
jgi:cysteinyl-tRNA synthetase